MIAYVETNFVLELGLSQEEHESCRGLLDLVKESSTVELALPAVSVGEAYDAFERKRRHRAELHDALRGEIGQLTRSAVYGERSGELREITSMLVAANRHQRQRLNAVLEEVLAVARVLPMDAETFSAALVGQRDLGFGPHDSLVYASVLEDLRLNGRSASQDQPSTLITRNPKDFADESVAAGLAAFGCKPLFTFRDGLNYTRGRP